MGIDAVGGGRGIVSDVNVVPLIDILLVLLVIFMIIPHWQQGLQAELPQLSDRKVPFDSPKPIIVQIASDGSVRINQSAVKLEDLSGRLQQFFAPRSDRVAFLKGDRCIEFQVVAHVLDTMHSAGAAPIGLLTSELEKNR
jgi:biopolymer transport protein ExbD/biopolymer transport protein TolR